MIEVYTDYRSKVDPSHWVRVVKTEDGMVYFAVYEAGVWLEYELSESEFVEYFEVRDGHQLREI